MHTAQSGPRIVAEQNSAAPAYNKKAEITQSRFLQEVTMYNHGIFETDKAPLKKLDPLAMRVEREKDRLHDREIRAILLRRPRQRPQTHWH
jgi:hypothetical protein